MRTSGKRSSHEKTLEKLDKSLKADALVKEDENWVDTDGWRSETKEENEKADPDWTKKWEKKQKKNLEREVKYRKVTYRKRPGFETGDDM